MKFVIPTTQQIPVTWQRGIKVVNGMKVASLSLRDFKRDRVQVGPM